MSCTLQERFEQERQDLIKHYQAHIAALERDMPSLVADAEDTALVCYMMCDDAQISSFEQFMACDRYKWIWADVELTKIAIAQYKALIERLEAKHL